MIHVSPQAPTERAEDLFAKASAFHARELQARRALESATGREAAILARRSATFAAIAVALRRRAEALETTERSTQP